MKALSRVYLTSVLTVVLLGDFAVTPGAGQAGAEYEPLGTPSVNDAPARSADGDSIGYGRHRELESILGREIHTKVEDGVGRIIDLLADRTGRVRAAVIEFGGFMGIGTRKIAVDWSALHFEGDGKKPQIILDMTRNQLRKAPEYKPSEPAVVRKANE